MIIKNYLIDGTLIIIENASKVVVHPRKYSFSLSDTDNRSFGPKPYTPVFAAHSELHDMLQRFDVKLVDYTDEDDVRHRLAVEGKAYVCNDFGRTIETVYAGNDMNSFSSPESAEVEREDCAMKD